MNESRDALLEKIANRIVSTLHLESGDPDQYLLSNAIKEFQLTDTDIQAIIRLMLP